MTTTNHRESAQDINPIFLERWSPRAYSGEPLTKEQLLTILEAAHWAPSASNHQPWRFIYGIKGTEAFEKLLGLLVPGNQRWAKNAGALVFVISQTKSGSAGDAERKPIATHAFDAGAAWMSLALQAQFLGLHAHGMAGLDYPRATEELGLPDGFRVEMAAAIGAQGRLEDLPEDLQGREKPSSRKSLGELAFEGAFKG